VEQLRKEHGADAALFNALPRNQAGDAFRRRAFRAALLANGPRQSNGRSISPQKDKANVNQLAREWLKLIQCSGHRAARG
jgi:hypothetical protein